jgi:hypothetical protein
MQPRGCWLLFIAVICQLDGGLFDIGQLHRAPARLRQINAASAGAPYVMPLCGTSLLLWTRFRETAICW